MSASNIRHFLSEDPEWLDFFNENGFCIIRDVWASDKQDFFLDRAIQFPTRVESDFRPLMQPQRTDTEFLHALRYAPVVKLVETALGGEASGLQLQFFFGRPGTRGFACHQDNFYVEAEAATFVSAWSAFSEVSPEMGGLFVYPGSHKYGRLPIVPFDKETGDHQDPNSRNEETVLPDGYTGKRVDVFVPKGAVVMLNGDVVHGSHDNSTDAYRYALLATYLRRGADFRPGRTAKREEIALHG